MLKITTLLGLALFALCAGSPTQAQASLSLNAGWQLQDAAKVAAPEAVISDAGYQPRGWYKAVVPGTVLTSLVAGGVYPEPLYGENNRPGKIPDALCRTAYWYRRALTVPASYAGKHVWLRFDGVNYAAEVWVNGHEVGTVRGRVRAGPVRCFPVRRAGAGGRTRRADTAAAPSGRPRGADHRGGRRQERRRDGAGRPDLPLHDGVGLDSRRPRPRHGAVAGRHALRDRAGDGVRPLRVFRAAPAAHRQRRFVGHGDAA